MKKSTSPLITIRLTAEQILAIKPGFVLIMDEYRQAWERGNTGVPRLVSTRPSATGGEGKWDQKAVKIFIDTWETLHVLLRPPRPARPRLHLDCFQISACALAARVTRRMLARGHLDHPLPSQAATLTRLLSTLERLRKQAKRRFIRLRGEAEYKDLSRRWRETIRFFQFTCVGPLLAPPHRVLNYGMSIEELDRWNRQHYGRTVFQQLIDLGVHVARRELQSRGVAVPPESELRRYVAMAYHNARRRRGGYSVMGMLNIPGGARHLADFVLRKNQENLSDD